MKEPWFWRDRSLTARIVAASLTPGAIVYDAARRWREMRALPAPAPAPIFCVGNATVGGVGKTPFALMLSAILREHDLAAHFLTRGYRGALAGPIRVDPDTHDARAVGDEALLLAAAAPTWISRNRRAGALAAASGGAEAVIMDDGYQNHSLEKTFSFLLTDATDPYGNGLMLPAGPLREPVAAALARADATVCVLQNKDASSVGAEEAGRAAFRAWLEPTRDISGGRFLAFCGIGRPQRFFGMLERNGGELAGAVSFPDHHQYSAPELARLRALAKKRSARLITTDKDYVRLALDERVDIETLPVTMACDDRARLGALALEAARRFRRKSGHDGA